MSGTDYVYLSNYVHSTPFRFALALTAIFLVAFVIAGLITYHAVNQNLDERMAQAAEMTASGFVDRYAAGDLDTFAAVVDSRTSITEKDDQLFWLGNRNGEKRAGTTLIAPQRMMSGDVTGGALNSDFDDRFRVAVRDFGALGTQRLIVAVSYEDADEIINSVLIAFACAAVFVVIFSGAYAARLAHRGQQRIEAIASTLRAVSQGELTARVPTTVAHDDLTRLASSINAALDRLETTVESIRQVSTDIAHDLRTPINRLAIKLQQMRQVGMDRKLEQDLSAADNEIRGICQTFDSLLRIAQIEAGVAKTDCTTICLQDIAAALYETYGPVAEENGQTLYFDRKASEDACVSGDQILVFQLFANLIENAICHCPLNTTIRIDIGAASKTRWMSIVDNGPGIPHKDRSRVLRRFYRLDKSRQTNGSGLGLALVKAVCDLHNATLSLADNKPGLIAKVVFGAPSPDAVLLQTRSP